MREADAARDCPIEHRSNHRTRLAEKRDLSCRCRQVRKSGIEAKRRYHDADAVGPDNTQQMGLGGVESGLRERMPRLAELAKTGGNDDGRAGPSPAKLADQRRHGFWWRDDNGEVWGFRQARDIRM